MFFVSVRVNISSTSGLVTGVATREDAQSGVVAHKDISFFGRFGLWVDQSELELESARKVG